MDALEPFYPERMAQRILGMGDMLTLYEKAQEAIKVGGGDRREGGGQGGVTGGQGEARFCYIAVLLSLFIQCYEVEALADQGSANALTS